jgi:DNA adenine methylase
MVYLGSKRRIAKLIMPIIQSHRRPGQWYVEPFCGGCNSLQHADNPRQASDANFWLVRMWQALVHEDWQPPVTMTREEYTAVRTRKDCFPDELVGWIGGARSFGGMFFSGPVLDGVHRNGENYAQQRMNNILRQVPHLAGTVFVAGGYDKVSIPPASVIYCDPPYEGTATYARNKEVSFTIDHDAFWQWCRDRAGEGHQVYVSEYNAPEDFICVWEKQVTRHCNGSKTDVMHEKLFVYGDDFGRKVRDWTLSRRLSGCELQKTLSL